jgi:hypothetical protein
MDNQLPDELTASSKIAPVDVRRRSLLGGATTGGIAVASFGAMALLRSEKAEASTNSGYTVYNAKDAPFNAVGNGAIDDARLPRKHSNLLTRQSAFYFPYMYAFCLIDRPSQNSQGLKPATAATMRIGPQDTRQTKSVVPVQHFY